MLQKIFAKVLSHRLDHVLTNFMNRDQIGFVRSRQIADNMRKWIHTIHYAKASDTPTIAVSLDAEKPFDHLKWSFLISALKNFGFGDTFIQLVHLIYANPEAKVSSNGVVSNSFCLQCGTW